MSSVQRCLCRFSLSCVLAAFAATVVLQPAPATAAVWKLSLQQLSPQFKSPMGVAVLSTGELVIGDSWTHQIYKLGFDGSITTLAGTGIDGFNGDGEALSVMLSHPAGITVTPNDEVIVADAWNNRIRKIANGRVQTIAGSGDLGYNGDHSALQTNLNHPYGVAVAPNGDIVIADTFNHLIRRLSPDNNIRTVLGTGIGIFNGDGLADDVAINFPYGVATTPQGELIIADTANQRIRLLSADETQVHTLLDISQDSTDAVQSGHIYYSLDVCSTTNGDIIFPDPTHERILKFVRAQNALQVFQEKPVGLFSPFSGATKITAGRDGSVYMTDGYGIAIISPNDELESWLTALVTDARSLDPQTARFAKEKLIALQDRPPTRLLLDTLHDRDYTQANYAKLLPQELRGLLSQFVSSSDKFRARIALMSLTSATNS